MAVCKFCGADIAEEHPALTVDGKQVTGLCKKCYSYLFCLVNEKVDPEAKMRAKDWAKRSRNLYIDHADLIDRCVAIAENQLEGVYQASDTDIHGKQTWSDIIGIISAIVAFLLMVVGGAVFSIFGDELIFVGVLLGLGIGVVIVSANMLMAEIARNTAKSVDLLNKISSELKKQKNDPKAK